MDLNKNVWGSLRRPDRGVDNKNMNGWIDWLVDWTIKSSIKRKKKLHMDLGKQIFVATKIWLQILESRARYPVNFLAVREKVSKAAKSSRISSPASPNAFKTVGLFSKKRCYSTKLDEEKNRCNELTQSLLSCRLTLLNLPGKLGPLGCAVIHLLQINTYTKCAFFIFPSSWHERVMHFLIVNLKRVPLLARSLPRSFPTSPRILIMNWKWSWNLELHLSSSGPADHCCSPNHPHHYLLLYLQSTFPWE